MAQPHAETDLDTTVYRPDSLIVLWAGVLLAPTAFMAGLIALYAMSGAQCVVRHSLVMHGIHAITTLLGVMGLGLAWVSSHHASDKSGGAAFGSGGRFLAQISVGSSALFVLVMLVQWGVNFAFSRCSG